MSTSSQTTDILCYNCKKAIGNKKCGKCGKSFYCSKECQIEHWKIHKTICNKVEKELVINQFDNEIPVNDDISTIGENQDNLYTAIYIPVEGEIEEFKTKWPYPEIRERLEYRKPFDWNNGLCDSFCNLGYWITMFAKNPHDVENPQTDLKINNRATYIYRRKIVYGPVCCINEKVTGLIDISKQEIEDIISLYNMRVKTNSFGSFNNEDIVCQKRLKILSRALEQAKETRENISEDYGSSTDILLCNIKNCGYCHKDNICILCPKCKTTPYCNKNCLTKAEKSHRKECKNKYLLHNALMEID